MIKTKNNTFQKIGNNSKKFKGCGDIGMQYMQTLQFSANTRQIPFDITIEQIWELFLKQNKQCIFTKEKLCFYSSRQKAKGFEQTASLDRIDSSKGYTIDNIQWVHKDVNYIKGKMTDSELINICTKIHNHQINPIIRPYDDTINQYYNPQNWKGFGEIGLTYFNEVKDKANKRHLSFEITIEYLWNLFLQQNRICIFMGELLRFSNRRIKNRGIDQTASLDRINSNLGYIVGNVQWIHKQINWMKHDMNQSRFLELCEKISKNKAYAV